MRIGECANTPAAQIGAVPVEDQHGRLLALENVDPVLRIGSDSAGIAECLSWWQLRPVLNEFVRIFASSYGCHSSLPLSVCESSTSGGSTPASAPRFIAQSHPF